MTDSALDAALALYDKLGQFPCYSRATFLSEESASVTFTIRDPILKKKRAFVQQITVSPDHKVVHMGSRIEDDSTGLTSLYRCGSTTLRAIQKAFNPTDGKNGKKRAIEIWDDMGNFLCALETTELHGDFYTDDRIGSLAWSSNGKYLVYIAAAKKKDKPDHFTDFVHDPTLGENYQDKPSPVLVLIEIEGTAPDAISKMNARIVSVGTLLPSRPFFVLDDTKIAFVGFESVPCVWGIAHCPNRPSRLYSMSLAGDGLEPLTPENEAVRSPIPHVSHSRALYLALPVGGPHNTCSKLVEYDFKANKTCLVVDYVLEPKLGEFPGLFTDSLIVPQQEYNTQVYANTQWNTHAAAIAINVELGHIERLAEPSKNLDATRVLAVSPKGRLVLVRSSLDNPPCLYIRDMNEETLLKCPSKRLATTLEETPATVKVFDHGKLVESILIQPRSLKGPGPLIIFPHGGPHGGYTNEWSEYSSTTLLAFVSLGYSIALVNYTGSTGYGKNHIDRLLGKIADLEVSDSHRVALELLDKKNLNLDRNNVFIMGGSHGGLTGACLVGQFPNFYRAAAIRNPAIHPGTFSGTDILDWAFAESGLPFDMRRPALATPEAYEQMWRCSAMRVIDRVETPTLVMLGARDSRVPVHQGLEWASWLRGNKPHVPIRTLMFPDTGHSLDSWDAQHHGFHAIVSFFEEFRKQ